MLAPRLPPAPPRLSMTTCLPSCLLSVADSGRAKASVPPPAAKGTIMITALVGQFCAPASRPRRASAAQASAYTSFMDLLPTWGLHILLNQGLRSGNLCDLSAAHDLAANEPFVVGFDRFEVVEVLHHHA